MRCRKQRSTFRCSSDSQFGTLVVESKKGWTPLRKYRRSARSGTIRSTYAWVVAQSTSLLLLFMTTACEVSRRFGPPIPISSCIIECLDSLASSCCIGTYRTAPIRWQSKGSRIQKKSCCLDDPRARPCCPSQGTMLRTKHRIANANRPRWSGQVLFARQVVLQEKK